MRDSRMTNLLMNHFLIVLALFACCVASAKNQNGSDFINILDAAQQIDLYIEEGLKTEGLERNEPVSDEFFVRRVYLDVVGRIPTYDELTEFMKSKSEDRRSELIDSLLSSEGYVSHHYNYWADVLRVKSRGRRTIMASYQDWIKESLRENQPYDEFVREMITSEGYVWDDPAVGY